MPPNVVVDTVSSGELHPDLDQVLHVFLGTPWTQPGIGW